MSEWVSSEGCRNEENKWRRRSAREIFIKWDLCHQPGEAKERTGIQPSILLIHSYQTTQRMRKCEFNSHTHLTSLTNDSMYTYKLNGSILAQMFAFISPLYWAIKIRGYEWKQQTIRQRKQKFGFLNVETNFFSSHLKTRRKQKHQQAKKEGN